MSTFRKNLLLYPDNSIVHNAAVATIDCKNCVPANPQCNSSRDYRRKGSNSGLHGTGDRVSNVICKSHLLRVLKTLLHKKGKAFAVKHELKLLFLLDFFHSITIRLLFFKSRPAFSVLLH
mmetsp:Transcript_1206/g.3997  ORF Transcript_1206/g.3997 Transcript_1206/m.3997 type:complete len:120 (-) Transcript_1206:48-407(-)